VGSVEAGGIWRARVTLDAQLDQLVVDQLHAGAHVLDDLRVRLFLFLGVGAGLDRRLADVREIAQHFFHFTAEPVARDGGLDSAVLYVDSFGNLRLAGVPDDLHRAIGELTPGRQLEVEFGADNGTGAFRERTQWARTFGDIPLGAPLVYEDSFGHLAYADNQGNVAARLKVATGRPVRIRPL